MDDPFYIMEMVNLALVKKHLTLFHAYIPGNINNTILVDDNKTPINIEDIQRFSNPITKIC